MAKIQIPFTGTTTVLLYSQAPQVVLAQNVVTVRFGLGGTDGVLVPLFFDQASAGQFAASLGQAQGMNPCEVGGFDALEQLLADLKGTGTTHVNFNADAARPNPIPIDEVLDSLRNRPRG
jgi:hypothetical protein